jgi:hypothetical protein
MYLWQVPAKLEVLSLKPDPPQEMFEHVAKMVSGEKSDLMLERNDNPYPV